MITRIVTPLSILLALLCNVGCGPAAKTMPPKVTVKGTVNIGAKPVKEGEVLFGLPDTPGIPLPITDGAFSGEVYEGKNRVEVFAFKDGPPLSTDPKGPPQKINIVAPKFNGPNTTLTADVSKDGPPLKFEVTSQ